MVKRKRTRHSKRKQDEFDIDVKKEINSIKNPHDEFYKITNLKSKLDLKSLSKSEDSKAKQQKAEKKFPMISHNTTPIDILPLHFDKSHTADPTMSLKCSKSVFSSISHDSIKIRTPKGVKSEREFHKKFYVHPRLNTDMVINRLHLNEEYDLADLAQNYADSQVSKVVKKVRYLETMSMMNTMKDFYYEFLSDNELKMART
jgi:hypothetical protein